MVEPTVADRAEQLLHEQRDPLRALGDQLEELAVRRLAEDRFDLHGHVLRGEPFELDALDQSLLLPARADPTNGMGAVQLVGADRRQHQQPAVATTRDQQRQQVERPTVGPLEVLEHERQRGHRR